MMKHRTLCIEMTPQYTRSSRVYLFLEKWRDQRRGIDFERVDLVTDARNSEFIWIIGPHDFIERTNVANLWVEPIGFVGRVEDNGQATRQHIRLAAGRGGDNRTYTPFHALGVGPAAVDACQGKERLVCRMDVKGAFALSCLFPLVEAIGGNYTTLGADGGLPSGLVENTFGIGAVGAVAKDRVKIFGVGRHEAPFHTSHFRYAIITNDRRDGLSRADVVAFFDASWHARWQREAVAEVLYFIQGVAIGHLISIAYASGFS